MRVTQQLFLQIYFEMQPMVDFIWFFLSFSIGCYGNQSSSWISFFYLFCERTTQWSFLWSRAGTGRKFVPGYPKPYYPRVLGYPLLLLPTLYLLINPDLAKKGKHSNVLQFIMGEIIEIDDDEHTEYCELAQNISDLIRSLSPHFWWKKVQVVSFGKRVSKHSCNFGSVGTGI